MKVPITNSLKSKVFAALLAAGVAGPSAYVATELTLPSEGFLTHLHLDPVGLPTTCIGHLVQKGETPKQTYTEDECITKFVKDWKIAENSVHRYVKVPFRTEWMEGALVDFTLNKGSGNFSKSTLLKDLNRGNYDQACIALTNWVYATHNGQKVKLPGLVIRATKQYKYCMGEEPAGYKQTMILWEQQNKESNNGYSR